MLLRSMKRRSSWDVPLDQFVKVELYSEGRPDMSLSVYAVEDEGPIICQTLAEHTAGCLSSPNNWGMGLESQAGGSVEETEGSGPFVFTRKAHREIRFLRESEFHAFASLIYGERVPRGREVTGEQLREYVSRHFKAGDQEWIALCADPEKKAWLKLANRAPPKQPGPASGPPPPPRAKSFEQRQERERQKREREAAAAAAAASSAANAQPPVDAGTSDGGSEVPG